MATYYVRPDGSDSNTGLGSTTGLAWATIAKVFSASGMASGDTVYIAPGHYNENIGPGSLAPTVATFIIGDPTAAQFAGVTAGVVKLSSFSSAGTAAPSLTNSLITFTNKNHFNFSNLYFESGTSGNTVVCTTGHSWSFTNCVFDMCMTSASFVASTPTSTAGNFTFSKCIFFNRNGGRTIQITGQNVADATSISDCLFLGSGASECVLSFNCQMAVTNCTFFGVNVGVQAQTGNVSFPSYVSNCLFAGNSIALLNGSSTLVYMTENYNRILGNATRVNMGTLGANSTTNGAYRISLGYEKMHGLTATDFFAPIASSPNQAFGTATGAPASDLYGTTWVGVTPDSGALTYKANTGTYQPTERNAGVITIAPGSTSQSIELYLGATGLTASTSGLSARYNRTRTASVSIPLVARTIAQAWTSGGFAEVDATNMPGVYRLDLPDAALAAGADDVTVVVRGASGTNGAVMTIKLSSGGLTSAQTASAVWGADVAGYVAETNFGGVVNATRNVSGSTEIIAQDIPSNVWEELTTNHTTHNTFGWNILRADAQSKQGLVTLASSGGTNRVDADVHAIVNDAAAAAELKGALLHTGGDYITADLQTPITSTVSPAVGPFTVLPSGAGADNIVDLNVGSALPLVLNLQDGSGAPFNASGATVTATVYTAGGSTVTTYTGSIIAGYIGAISVPLSTAVTATSATYTMLVSVVIGTTTTVFGPLKLVVRAI